MTTHETVRPMSTGQMKDIITTLIGGIPSDLTFEEARSISGDRGKLLEGVEAAFKSFRSNSQAVNSASPSTYSLVVPYKGKTTISELVAAGRYDWVNENITDENFPQEKDGEEEIGAELIHLKRVVSKKVLHQ